VIAAVVLAAGLARRMGRQKLLLQLQGKPVVRWSVEHVVSHVEDVVIVTGPDDSALRQALEGLTVRFVVNPRPQDGQGTSIAAGVAALKPWTTAVLIAQGTPVVFSSEVFAELRALKGDAGARAVVKENPERVELVAFDLAMPPDVDTPEDYAKLHVQ
jgi:molybdenum cofactor cytidylyltransferase